MTAIRNLILIGYRGTGKTTVGRLLAEKLDWAFVDADDEVQRRAGKTIAQIFADQGESAFRDVEEQGVMDLVQRSEHIVSLGGGAILRENNRRAICAAGSAIWLTASPETIHARLQSDSATAERRPNLTQQGGLAEIRKLLAQRDPHYRACASFAVGTDTQSAEEIAASILQRIALSD